MSVLLHPDRLAGVDPRIVAFCQRCAALMPFDVLVVYGVRTEAQQLAMYAKGRSVTGPNVSPKKPYGDTVTDAEHAKDSAHGHAGGVDLVPIINGRCDWDDLEKFRAMMRVAKGMGLVCGGDFSKRDWGHFEVPDWRKLPIPPEPPPPAVPRKAS